MAKRVLLEPGKRYGKWIVVGPDPEGRADYWQFRCTGCNKLFVRAHYNIRMGKSSSCKRCATNASDWFVSEHGGKKPVPGVDVPHRKCNRCGKNMTAVFHKGAARGWSYACAPCNAASQKARWHTPEGRRLMNVQRLNTRFKQYGITPEQGEQLWEAQGKACAICGVDLKTPARIRSIKDMDTHIDHCHETGEVRGVLCQRCNQGIGLFKDDALRLQKAIRYLNGGNRDLISAVLHGSDEGSEHGGISDAGSDAAA